MIVEHGHPWITCRERNEILHKMKLPQRDPARHLADPMYFLSRRPRPTTWDCRHGRSLSVCRALTGV